MLKRNELTGNKTDNPDFLKVLLTLKANIMKDLNVCEICKVVDISKDSYIVNPINNTKEKLYCKTVTNSTINKGDLVLVIFTNSDYRLNLKKIKAGEKPQEVAQTDLHSRNYGVIIATGSSTPQEVYSKVYVDKNFVETFNADTKANVDDLNKEINDRKNADSVLQTNIDKEATNRQNADTILQQNKADKSTTINSKSLNDNIILYGTDIELARDTPGNITDAISNINRRVDNILLNAWPVNSVYISVESTSPSSFIGGTWEQLPEGYALWTTLTGVGGDTIAPGLPNITGTAQEVIFRKGTIAYDGVFSSSSDLGTYWDSNKGDSYQGRRVKVNFNASSSNSIYGASDTVQPPAIKIYAWKRVS